MRASCFFRSSNAPWSFLTASRSLWPRGLSLFAGVMPCALIGFLVLWLEDQMFSREPPASARRGRAGQRPQNYPHLKHRRLVSTFMVDQEKRGGGGER